MANTNAITALYNLGTQVIAVPATETVLTHTINGVTSSAVLAIPANANVDSHSFIVRLIGKANGGTGSTLTLAFRLGSLTGTKVAAFTVSAAVPTAGSNFSVYATFTWDSVSGQLNGTIDGQVAQVLTAHALSTQGAVTSVDGLQFVATASFGGALTTNSVSVEEFTAEAI